MSATVQKDRAGTTVLVVTVLVLGVAIMYLMTRIRRQDRIVDKLRKETQQTLNDQDVVQIIDHYVHSQPYQQDVQRVSNHFAQHYTTQYAQHLEQLYSQRFDELRRQSATPTQPAADVEPSPSSSSPPPPSPPPQAEVDVQSATCPLSQPETLSPQEEKSEKAAVDKSQQATSSDRRRRSKKTKQ